MILHNKVCSANHDEYPLISLSLDGVQESRSSSISMDIYSIKFHGCRNIYPLRLIRPNEKYKYDEQEELANAIADLNNSDLVLDHCVLDNPKRCVVQNKKSCCARFPCEYCEAPAINYIDENMIKNQLTWPPTTMNGRPRTITAIRRIVNSIEEGDEDLTKEYLKGIKGRSVLLYQPNFDIIQDVPTEYMHLVCLGVVKNMIIFTYNVGKKKNKNYS